MIRYFKAYSSYKAISLGVSTLTKIKLQHLVAVLSSDVINNNTCIEMEFSIDDTEYNQCWLGKMPDRDNPKKEIYWIGLNPDGSQAYEYKELEDLLKAKILDGNSLYEVIDRISWHSLDGCSIEERLSDYLDYK